MATARRVNAAGARAQVDDRGQKKRLLLASGRINQINGAVQPHWRCAIGMRQHGNVEWAIRRCGIDGECALGVSMTERAWSGRRVASAASWQVRTPNPDDSTGAHAVVPPLSVFTAPRESARLPHGADHWLPQERLPQRSLCGPTARRLGLDRVAPERVRTSVPPES